MANSERIIIGHSKTWGERNNKTCENCVFFLLQDPLTKMGACHRRAPNLYSVPIHPHTGQLMPTALMVPSVKEDFGCGDHEGRPPEFLT